MAHSFLFNDKQFNRLFPFYILVNRKMQVIAMGKSISKLCELNVGQNFNQLFTIPRPFTSVKSIDDLISLESQLVIIESVSHQKTMLRGQFEYMAETEEVLFVGSPWFGSMEQVRENNLVIDDFARHDPLIDLLHVMKSQEITNDDLKDLVSTINKQKNELKKATNEAHDIALFTKQNPDPLIRINFNGDLLQNNPAAALLDFFEFENKTYRNDEFFTLLAERIDKSIPRCTIEAKSEGKDYSLLCVTMKDVGYINIYGRDITEQKNNEEKLKVLSKIAEDNINAVIIADKDGKITWANKSFVEMTGYSFQEAIGKKPGKLLQGPETDKNTINYLRKQISSAEPFNTEIVNYAKNGNKYWLRIQGQPVKNEKGEITGFFALEEDITKEKESEYRFRKALENIGDNVWEHDFKTGKTYFSKSENEFLGYDTNELTNNQQLWWDSVFKEDLHLLIENDKEYKSGKKDTHNLEYRIVHQDGNTRWVLDRGVVIDKDRNGKPLRITGTHTDITERKNAEEILEKQRKFYEDILNNMPADIAVFNPKHEYLFVNPRGIKDEELRKWIIGKRDEDYCSYRNKPQSIAQDRRKTFNNVLESKKPSEWEEKNITPNGEEQYMLRRWFPVLDHDKNVSLIIGYGIDITERKKFELALKINEEKYRGIIANMNLGLMEMDLERKINFANQTLLNMTGLTEQEANGFDASQFLSNDSISEVNQRMDNREKGISEAYEVQTNISGKPGWWFVSSAPKFNEKGEYIGSIVICLDISNQKNLEKELIKSREQAEQLSKAKEIFLANMSHEIRTPMNAIMGMGNQLAKTNLTEQQDFYLNTINTAAENLLVIINDILDLSKIEAGKLSVEKIGFEPKKVVGNAMQVLMHKAEEKGLKLTNSFCDSRLSPILIGDPYRLNQVLLNLISNAIKFTEKGSVDVTCEVIEETETTQTIQARVIDTGIGMEKEFAEKLFDKFSQEYESVSRRYGGTGLGMSICKELLELMGGKIEVLSTKGKGTTVLFRIQFEKGSKQDIFDTILENISDNFLANKTILVTDDNDMNRLVASTILGNYGANIIEATNGEEAIFAIENNKIDLVLMDIQMPVMNGYDASITTRKRGMKVPIIALTANAIKGENEKCLESGMNDYIAKPFKEEEFLKKIAHWLNAELKTTKVNSDIEPVEETLYDLSNLQEISRGNDAFIEKMVRLFCDQTPQMVLQMKDAYSLDKLEIMAALAHKLKPSIDNLNINLVKQVVRNIEKAGKENTKTQELAKEIEFLEEIINKTINKFKQEFPA